MLRDNIPLLRCKFLIRHEKVRDCPEVLDSEKQTRSGSSTHAHGEQYKEQ